MRLKITLISLLSILISCHSEINAKNNKRDIDVDLNTEINYIELSAKLLENLIQNNETTSIQTQLATVTVEELSNQLTNDTEKKVFWINVYNAHIQIILKENPDLYEDRGAFFKKKQITIAGEILSFDDIEHGIIRSSTIKLSWGLLKNPFVGQYERTFRTNETDPRIHFALNCGAKSCPLVAVYHEEGFEKKIDAVAINFLKKETNYNIESNKVKITPLFSWFRGDFGGKKGIKKFLINYKLIQGNTDPELVFLDYDWTLSLGNYYAE
ncbi:DUF547 domain-containing protein [bacterium]|nr:DUF547 domain-containing protein [bacterium]